MELRAFDRVLAVVATGVAVVLLCVPLLWVYSLHLQNADPRAAAGGEVTVGIAVILRATVRRFMRTASNQFMRTTFGVVGRASARAATRRIVKAATKITVASAVQDASAEAEADGDDGKPQSAVFALVVGGVALGLSFWGILHVVADDVVARLLGNGAIGVLAACVLVAVPLFAYAACHAIFGRMFGVAISYRTEIDGLLLQGYFTGSGSFLPMTTDVEYAGSERGKCGVAIGALLSMLAIHVLLMLLARGTGSVHLEFVGAAFLIYAFIYVFPINPLEGTFIWRQSRWLWLLVASPILVAFLYFLPASFGEIL